MKKVLVCMAFCLFLAPGVAFGSPQQSDNQQPAKQVQQTTAADENSIAGSTDPDLTPVQRGCCSWHGGVAGCDARGRVTCNDGTTSPTCRC